MLQMKVKAVTVDQGGNFLVLLMDEEERKVLPISIGPVEAQSIALALQGKTPPRPLTHDLLKIILENLRGNLQKIVITDIIDSTFYAEIYLEQDGEAMVLDSRPSDAIALALRCGTSIYMATKMVEFTYDYEDIISGGDASGETH
ncbi:MAG: bifunctional nuclease family protein [Dethiobacteria bacterium]